MKIKHFIFILFLTFFGYFHMSAKVNQNVTFVNRLCQFDYYTQGGGNKNQKNPKKNRFPKEKVKRKLTKREKKHKKLVKAIKAYKQKQDSKEITRLKQLKSIDKSTHPEYNIRHTKPQLNINDHPLIKIKKEENSFLKKFSGEVDYKAIKKRIEENRKEAHKFSGEVDYKAIKKHIKENRKEAHKFSGEVDYKAIKKRIEENRKEAHKFSGEVDYKAIKKRIEENRKEAHKFSGEYKVKRLHKLQQSNDKHVDKFKGLTIRKPRNFFFNHQLKQSVDLNLNLKYRRNFLTFGRTYALTNINLRNGTYRKKFTLRFFSIKKPNYKLVLKPYNVSKVKLKYDKKEAKIWRQDNTR